MKKKLSDLDLVAIRADETKRQSARLQSSKKAMPIHGGEKRKHLVSRIMDVLRDWRSSPFENEAACLHGLRQAFCIQGHGWSRADAEAASLVAEGLRLMGAQRPSWDQGQRQYVEPKENCNWCSMPIPDLDLATRRVMFCSEVCARSALQQRSFEDRYSNSIVGRAAYDLIVRGRNDAKSCAVCERSFRPFIRKRPGLYCSTTCRNVGQRNIPRPCRQCGKAFRPPRTAIQFCSAACYQANRVNQVKRSCTWCSKPYVGSRRYCSHGCESQHHSLRTGKWTPKRLSPPVFDCVFKMAA